MSDEYPPTHVLHRLASLEQVRREAAERLSLEVCRAREENFTWDEIGFALGLTKPGAIGRYAKIVPKVDMRKKGNVRHDLRVLNRRKAELAAPLARRTSE
jgi:hypothetical protein